ncbi:MAG: hypothetical protein ACREJM_10655, partial [Candidatus Saccharimonadales bacterium]
MKSLLVTTLGMLPLSLALTSMGLAQEAEPLSDVRVRTVPAVPVADAKQRLRDAQKQLDQLSQGEKSFEPLKRRLDVAVVQTPRDQLRVAVAEAFDARRQLQQSELAELERRIANIKKALQISDAMRETIIDQRTDELLDQIEEGGKRGGSSPPGGGRPGYPGAKDGAATPPAEGSSTNAEKNQRLAALEEKREAEMGVQGAEANFATAKQTYDYSKKMHAKGFVTQLDVDAKSASLERAKLALEYAREKLNILGGTTADGEPATDPPPADPNANTMNHRAELLALDVREAEANLESAKRAYQRVEKLFTSGAVEQAILDEQADKYNRAQLQVERAEVELNAFIEAHGPGANQTSPAERDAAEADTRKRLAALDVKVAEANFAAAETKYERVKRHFADKAIDQSALDQQAAEYQRAQIQLERAKAKLKAIDGSPMRDRSVDEPAKSSSDQAPIDDSQITWGPTDYQGPGEPIAALQLGYLVEPKKAAYSPQEVLTVKLFLKYTGKQPGTFKAPRSEILENLGIDLVPGDAGGGQLDWQWGPAHTEALKPSGHDLVALAPGAIYQFPPVKLVVGRAKMVGRRNYEPSVFAYLHVKPGQTAQLMFKLTR